MSRVCGAFVPYIGTGRGLVISLSCRFSWLDELVHIGVMYSAELVLVATCSTCTSSDVLV